MMNRSRSDVMSVGYLSECFVPNYSEGSLIWKHRPLSHFTDTRCWRVWNTKYAGKPAGSLITKGKTSYFRTTVNNMYFYNHQILWMMFYEWCLPEYEIDHIDRDSTNNSIRNLRLTTRRQQVHNTGSSNVNAKGVCFDITRGLWQIQFKVGNESFSGRFSNQTTASVIYDILSHHYHKEYYYGGSDSGGESIMYSEITPKLRKRLATVGQVTVSKFEVFFEGFRSSRIVSRRCEFIKGVSYIKSKKKFRVYKTKDFGDGTGSLGYYGSLLDACCARISWENSMRNPDISLIN